MSYEYSQVHIVTHTYSWEITENQEIYVFKSGLSFKLLICIILKLVTKIKNKTQHEMY